MVKEYMAEMGEEHDDHIKFRQNALAARLGLESDRITTNYLRHLTQLLAEIRIPDNLLLMSNLASTPQYCVGFICYRNTIFNVKGSVITATTQKYELSLQRRILLTCNIVQPNKLSIYHNTLATIEKDFYIPEDKILPKLSIDPIHQAKSNIPRKPSLNELLSENILILYKDTKIAAQCIKPQHLIFDGTPYLCMNNTLEWFDPPRTIQDKESMETIYGHTNFKSQLLTIPLQPEFDMIDISDLVEVPFNQTHFEKLQHFLPTMTLCKHLYSQALAFLEHF